MNPEDYNIRRGGGGKKWTVAEFQAEKRRIGEDAGADPGGDTTEYAEIKYRTVYEPIGVALEGAAAAFAAFASDPAIRRIADDVIAFQSELSLCAVKYPGLPIDRLGQAIRQAARHTPHTSIDVLRRFQSSRIVSGAYQHGVRRGYRGLRLLRGVERALRHDLGILGRCDDTITVRDDED